MVAARGIIFKNMSFSRGGKGGGGGGGGDLGIGTRLLVASLELKMDHTIVAPSVRGVDFTMDDLLLNDGATLYCNSLQHSPASWLPFYSFHIV